MWTGASGQIPTFPIIAVLCIKVFGGHPFLFSGRGHPHFHSSAGGAPQPPDYDGEQGADGLRRSQFEFTWPAEWRSRIRGIDGASSVPREGEAQGRENTAVVGATRLFRPR